MGERRHRTDRRSGLVDRRSRGDRRAQRRPGRDRRSAYPDRRMQLFDRRRIENVLPRFATTRPALARRLAMLALAVLAAAAYGAYLVAR